MSVQTAPTLPRRTVPPPWATLRPESDEERPAATASPVSVTVEVKLTGGDALATASRVAAALPGLATGLTTDSGSTVDVSTTVAILVDAQALGASAAGRTAGPHLDRSPLEPPAEGGEPAPRAARPDAADAVVRVYPDRRTALVEGRPESFTRREFDLLLFLAENPGRVFTRSQLLGTVWGHRVVSGERTVDVHVRRLRAKLGEAGAFISTVRGVGYRLEPGSRVAVLHDPA